MARKPVFYVKQGSIGKNNRRFTLDTCLECGVINVIRSLCVYGRGVDTRAPYRAYDHL